MKPSAQQAPIRIDLQALPRYMRRSAVILLSRRLALKTREWVQMWLDGASVEGICHELGMKRRTWMRAYQRAIKLDPTFPRRDPETDRAES